jgi:hypothetical protein
MNGHQEIPSDVAELLNALCEGDLDPQHARRLENLVCSDPAVRRFYLRYIDLHVEMCRRYGYRDSAAADAGLHLADEPTASREAAGKSAEGSLVAPASVGPAFLTIGDAASAAGGYLSAANWPVAYLIATVVFAVALAIGGIIHVSQPERQGALVGPSSGPQYPIPALPAGRPIVGQITGMVDCVLNHDECRMLNAELRSQKTDIQDSSFITQHSVLHLGDTLALRSGLLEITYDSGARVVLQGPVTYEIESSVGGYLSVGKLAAKLEKMSEVRGQRSEHANQKSEITNQKFSVRTPMAVVTDLGTEFGIEVGQGGATSTHVFQGVVEVRGIADGSQDAQSVRLVQNESIRVERHDGGNAVVVQRGVANPAAFVRCQGFSGQRPGPLQRWRAYSERLRKDPSLVAYYTFESPGGNPSTLPNVSAAGSTLDGCVEGGDWVYGRLPGKYAICFHGTRSDRVVLPKQERFKFKGAFSAATWFKFSGNGAHAGQALVGKADTSWLLECDLGMKAITFDTRNEPFPGAPPPFCHLTTGRTEIVDGRWHLAVGVYEPVGGVARKQLFIDGRLDATGTTPLPLYQNDNPVWIGGNSELPDRMMCGFIDEVAILGRALSVEEVAAMYEAGQPADSGGDRRDVNHRSSK